MCYCSLYNLGHSCSVCMFKSERCTAIGACACVATLLLLALLALVSVSVGLGFNYCYVDFIAQDPSTTTQSAHSKELSRLLKQAWKTLFNVDARRVSRHSVAGERGTAVFLQLLRLYRAAGYKYQLAVRVA
ncbi:uncharacterized protein LOC105398090 [Plutella xylostella]|uniref:uncharacterized protein LOC105398090 n=1 Tax=Plutella xylostella TaxID=51655 RepID=UPI0018D0CFEA|nr:uncharacterized protein LOC105398090 [Plutella xylostella]